MKSIRTIARALAAAFAAEHTADGDLWQFERIPKLPADAVVVVMVRIRHKQAPETDGTKLMEKVRGNKTE